MFTNTSEKIKLSFGKPKYSRDGNAVHCSLPFWINVPSFEYMSDKLQVERYLRNYSGMNTAVGTAKCSPEDNFDKNVGRKIAQARAESAAYMMAEKAVADLRSQLLFYVNMINDFDLKKDGVITHNLQYVKDVEAVANR